MLATNETHSVSWLEAERKLAAQWGNTRPQPRRPSVDIDLTNIDSTATMFDPSR